MFEGITHVEDLKIDQFIDALRNFEEYEVSEKIDGSNIQFGIDEGGFYTSREDKGGKRMHDVSDHPINFSTTFQRSAHAALEKVLPQMIDVGLARGDRVEAEVLFGKLPNAVPYSSEENEIILLRTIDGDVKIDALKNALVGETIYVAVDSPYTIDGKTIHMAEEEHKWTFAKTPSWEGNELIDDVVRERINRELDELDLYLKKPSGIWKFSNVDILGVPLNKRPEGIDPKDWSEIKERVKKKRVEVHKHVQGDSEDGHGYKLRIKELLLNDLVRQIKSEFGPEIEDGGWIEGVVFKHKKTGAMFKVVDKDMFLTVKNFIWQVRSELAERPRSVNTLESFLGKLLVGLATSTGHPELGTMQAKRYLKKFGDTPEEIVQEITDGMDFSSLKGYWTNYINQQEKKLSLELDKYKDEKGDKKVTVDFGGKKREFHYDDEVDKRTMQVFASVYKQLEAFKLGIKRARSSEDLLKLLVGRQLSEI